MSIHAIGATEKHDTYVWEDLTAARFEDGATALFGNTEPKGALHEYAIAGTLHLDHLADLRRSPQGGVTIDRSAFQLSRSLEESQTEIESRLNRLLKHHEEEWKSFVRSLGPNSFVAGWARGAEQHVT